MDIEAKTKRLNNKYVNSNEKTSESLFPVDSNTLTPQMKKKIKDTIKLAKEFTAAPCIHGVMDDRMEKWFTYKGMKFKEMLDELKGVRIPHDQYQVLENHYKSFIYYIKKLAEKKGVKYEDEPIEVQEGKKLFKELQALAIEYLSNKKNDSLTNDWLMNQGMRFLDISQSPLKYKLPYRLQCRWGCIVHDFYYEIKKALPKQENELQKTLDAINALYSKKSKEEKLWEEVTSDISKY